MDELNNGVQPVDTATTINENIGADTSQNNEPLEGVEKIETTPKEQSENKDNPANKAFAELRRKNKEFETKLGSYTQADKEVTELAKSLGYEGVTDVNSFLRAVKQEELATKYKETQDPTILAEMMKESMFSDPRFSQSQTKTEPANVDDALNSEIEEFNKSFDGKLTSFDDILNLPNSAKILDYMDKSNLPLIDAYKLANPEEYADRVAKASKQQAINQARGLSHVKSNATAGEIDPVTVTAGEISQWKSWFPNKTEEQCRKEIANNKKLFVD